MVIVNEGLVLLQPGRTVTSWHFQLDVELLQCLFQLLLVSSVVRSYGIMEQDELVMQYFHLCGYRKRWEWAHLSQTQIYRRIQITERKKPVDLVLFQELQLDGDIVSHPLVLLSVHLEQLLGLFNLGQSVGITWSKIQLLQISTVRIVLNPVCDWNRDRNKYIQQFCA